MKPLYVLMSFLIFCACDITGAGRGDMPYKIAMLGDSITEYGDWRKLTGRNDIANFGIRGETTSQILRRVPQVIVVKPEKVFVLGGINDFYQEISPEEVFGNIRKIYDTLNDRGIKVYLQTVMYTGERDKSGKVEAYSKAANEKVTKFNVMLREFCKEKSISLIDANALMSENGKANPVYLLPDQVHLSDRGYEKWMEGLRAEMK